MTVIFKNPAFYSMRALVLSAFDRIQWRHHGIGVLQGYVCEDVEPEIRIHVWSRRLLKPGMEISGDIHDHRFDMVSHVLAGAVWHGELNERPDPDGDHAMMALTHARAATETLYHGPTTVLEGRFSVSKVIYKIEQGWSYSFSARKFHHSPIDSDKVSVTCIEKHGQRSAPARLLYPIAHEPVMAFGHRPDPDVVKMVLELAKGRLQEAL